MNNEEQFLLYMTRQLVNHEEVDIFKLQDLNIQDLLRFAYKHRIFSPLYVSALSKLKQSPYYPHFLALMNIEKKSRQSHTTEIVSIAKAFEQDNIPYIFIKGISQEQLLYQGKALRDVGDIDLIVKPEDRDCAYTILHHLGYRQPGQGDTLVMKGNCHAWEVGLYKDGVVPVNLELKTASSALRKNFEQLFSHTQFIELEGTKIRTLNGQATLVHIFANAHEANEARGTCKGTVLRDYYESMLILRKVGLDQEVIEIAEITESRHKIYEVLRSLDDLYGLTQEEKLLADQFHISHCGYSQEIDGWSNKSEDVNGALLFNPFKPEVQARLFDDSYAFYLFCQNLKNAVFHRPTYKHRHFVLKQQGDFVTMPYEGRDGVSFELGWDNGFHFKTKLNKNTLTKEEIEQARISIEWYERDILKPNLMLRINITMRNASLETESFAEITGLNLYKDSHYKYIVSQFLAEKQLAIVPILFSESESSAIAHAVIPMELLPIDMILPTLVCEVVVNINGISYDSETNTISFNFYN